MIELNHQVTYKTCDETTRQFSFRKTVTHLTIMKQFSEHLSSCCRDCYKLIFITNLWPGHTETFCNTLTHRNSVHKQSNHYDDRLNIVVEESAEWNRAVQAVVWLQVGIDFLAKNRVQENNTKYQRTFISILVVVLVFCLDT